MSVCRSPKAAFAFVIGSCRGVKHAAVVAAAAHSRGCSCGCGLRAVDITVWSNNQSAVHRIALKTQTVNCMENTQTTKCMEHTISNREAASSEG